MARDDYGPLDLTTRLALRPAEAAEALAEDGLVTVTEAAGFLRLSRTTIYTLMDQGTLPFVKIGRSRRIPLDWVANAHRDNWEPLLLGVAICRRPHKRGSD